jgi:hypothetical protein
MSAKDTLLKSEECAMFLVDFQAGLGFGIESLPVQVVLNNAVALARTAAAFIDSGDRIDFCVACVQRAFSSRPAESASFRKADRKKKYERLGR